MLNPRFWMIILAVVAIAAACLYYSYGFRATQAIDILTLLVLAITAWALIEYAADVRIRTTVMFSKANAFTWYVTQYVLQDHDAHD
jgi:hypothetical protein